MYSPEMRYRYLARLACEASGITDPIQRERFREEFLSRLRTDPDFLAALEDRAKNLSTVETEIGQGRDKE